MRKRRGSAMVLTLMLAISATTAVLTISALATQTAKVQTAREQNMMLKYSLEGVLARVEQSMGYKTLSLGVDTNYTVNGVTWKTNTIDYSATKAKSYRVTVSGTWKGKAITRTYVIGNPYVKHLAQYALYSNKKLTFETDVDTSSNPSGSVFANDDLDVKFLGCSVGGNLEVVGTVKYLFPLTVSGSTTTGVSSMAFPTFSDATYSAAANLNYSSSSATSADFPSNGYLVYRAGDLTFSGQVTNKGTVYVTGNLTVNGNVTYADSNAMIVFIVKGNITITNGANFVRGIYLSNNNLTISSSLSTMNCNQTIFAANNNLDIKRALNITFDDRIKNNQRIGYTQYVPGYWP